jgi:tRNA (guanine37-N1)-methyltransferase
MRFDLVSIFPEMLLAPLRSGVIGRALAGGTFEVRVHDLRDFADPPRRTIDDEPYGGGAGMVFRPEPLARAIAALREPLTRTAVVATSPAGEVFDQSVARELCDFDQVVILCDRYEGSDGRVAEWLTHEVSLGDFVLTGGEIAALAMVDAVAREAGGVVGHAESVARDSFASGILDHRSFTRPPRHRRQAVPEVILSGHHARVAVWRRRDAIRRTLERRPDLLDGAPLGREEALAVGRERGPAATI